MEPTRLGISRTKNIDGNEGANLCGSIMDKHCVAQGGSVSRSYSGYLRGQLHGKELVVGLC